MPPVVGLRLPSPMAQSMGMDNRDVLPKSKAIIGAPSPYRDFLEGAQTGTGLQTLGPSPVDTSLKQTAESIISSIRGPEAAPPALSSQIAYSPSTRTFAVNEFTFSEDDYAGALESQNYLNKPAPIPSKGASDWRRVQPEEYAALIDSIKNPGLFSTLGKGFEAGVAGLGVSTGALMQLAGAEGMGGALTKASSKRLSELAPFTPEFTDVIEGDARLTTWLTSAIAKAGPSILESIAFAAAGAGAGFATGAAAGGVGAAPGAVTGAVAGMFGKAAVKKQLLEIARKKLAKEAVSEAEEKAYRRAAAIAGATATSYLANVGNLSGETYAEMRAAGVDPEDVRAKLLAVGAGALGAIPETVLEGKLVSSILTPKKGISNIFGRVGVGALGYGTAEGATEATQDALGMGATKLAAGENYSPDVVANLINSFAAGFVVGAPLGGMASIRSNTENGKATNLLDTKTVPPAPAPAVGAGTRPLTPNEELALSMGPLGQSSVYNVPLGGQQEMFDPSTLGTPPVRTLADYPVGTQGNLFGASLPEQTAPLSGQLSLPLIDTAQTVTAPSPVTTTGINAGTRPLSTTEELALTMGPLGQAGAYNIPVGGQQEMFDPSTLGTAPLPAAMPQGNLFGGTLPEQVAPPSGQMSLPLIYGGRGWGGEQGDFGFPTTLPPVGQRALMRPSAQEPAKTTAKEPKPYRDLFKRANIEREKKFREAADLKQAQNETQEIINRVTTAPNRAQLARIVEELASANRITGAQAKALRNQISLPPRSIGLKPLKDAIIMAFNPPAPKGQKLRTGGRQPSPGKKPEPAQTKGKADEGTKPSTARVAKEEQAKPSEPAKRKPRGPKPATEKAAAKDKRLPEESPSVQDQVEIKTGAETVTGKPEPAPVDPNVPNEDTFTLAGMIDYAIKYWNDPSYTKDDKDADMADMSAILRKGKVDKAFKVQEGAFKISDFFMADGQVNKPKFISATKRGPAPTVSEPLKSKGIDYDGLWDQLYDIGLNTDAKGPYLKFAKKLFDMGAISQNVYDDIVRIGKDKDMTGPDLEGEIRLALEQQSKKSKPGNYVRTDGTPIAQPVAPGKLKMIVANATAKFAKKPDVTIVANVEELKRSNRALYNRALKARPDLDTVAASGVSFGDQVVLFSDNIRTEQEAKFVLAHEALGHFGLRSIMTQQELNTALDDLYENSDNIKYTAQRKMNLYGINQREATEEALSDLAATLDTNALYRIWSYIKNALTKITGIKFGDEEARRLVWQARRYVRTGNAGVTTDTVIQDGAAQMAAEYDVGMFNRLGAGHAKGDILSAFYPSSETSSSELLTRAKDIFANAKDLKRFVSRGIEQLATADEKAMRSRGYEKGMELYTAAARVRQQILTEVEKLTKVTNESSISDEDRATAEKLLAFANNHFRTKNSGRAYQELGSLISVDTATGETKVDRDVLNKLKALGRLDIGTARSGFEAENVDGESIKHEPLPGLKEDSSVWKIYNEQRDAVDFTALELLRSVYKEQYNKLNTSLQKIERMASTELTPKDIYVLRRVSVDYLDIYNEGATTVNGKYMPNSESTKRAEEFIVEVLKTLHSDAKVKDWQTGNTLEIAGQYQDPKYKYIVEAAPRLRSLGISQKNQVDKVLPLFQNMALDNLKVREAENRAKDTIALGYVPFVRRGKFYVRAMPVDGNGKSVYVSSDLEHILPFTKMETAAERDAAVARLTAAFGDKTYTVNNSEGQPVEVKFKIETGLGTTSAATTEESNPVTLVRQLERYNISLTQEERERLIDAIADFNSAARRSLYRTNNPGWDKNTIRNIAEWVNTFANIAGKNEYAYLIADVLDNKNLWFGDPKLLRSLYDELEAAKKTGNQATIRIAADKFERYAHQYIVSAPTSSQPIKLGDKVYQGQGQGARYIEDMKEMLRWFSRSADAVISTEDVLGEKGSALMAGAAIMQLGGNISVAAASVTSLPTHSMSYLSFRNSKRGYGGGFGPANAFKELMTAVSNVGGMMPKTFTDITFMEKMVAEGTHAKHGLTADEAVFLLDSLSDGTTLAAQANAIMDQSVGKLGNNLARRSVDAWMYMFVATDAMNRRVTALAAYRLYKKRLLASKGDTGAFNAKDPAALQADPDYKYAADNAKLAVVKSQGEHGAFNRPKIARGTLLRYPYMYQQIVVLTVQLMRNLPPAGQLYILAMLWLMSGIKGIPGEDDFADILDGVMQRTNQKWEGFDKYLTDMIDEYLPGASPILMRGIVDSYLGGSFSIKTGYGDIVPLTGLARIGADPARELENFVGPVWAAYASLVGTANSTLTWAGGTLGMSDRQVSLLDVLRESPFSGLKALLDAYVYMDTGQVINAKGEVISEDISSSVIMARLLGFYPAGATLNYDVVRMSRNLSEYSKAIKANYVLDYKRAKAFGDAEKVRRIIQDVREWNQSARGTPFEIKDFVSSAERAYKEAQRAPAARTLRTVSTSNQASTEELMAAMGID